jgi:hypothetical protein
MRCASSSRKDRVDTFFAELLHVLVDGVVDRGRGGLGRETEREANMATEVASAERRVVAVGEAEAASLGSRCRMARSTQVLPTPGAPVGPR